MHPILELLSVFVRESVDLALPPACAGCARGLRLPEQRADAICESCAAALPWIDRDACARCQEEPPLAAGELCVGCANPGAAASALASCSAALSYEGATESWIARFKYPEPGLRGLDAAPVAVARRLAREAASRVPGNRPELVVPVPLHPHRHAERGFNPAAIAAREIARHTGARYAPRILRRRRETPTQTGLDRRARRENVRDAFIANSRLGSEPIARRSIWLVDDVVTTGATLEACAEALRSAGATELRGVALARTPLHRTPRSRASGS